MTSTLNLKQIKNAPVLVEGPDGYCLIALSETRNSMTVCIVNSVDEHHEVVGDCKVTLNWDEGSDPFYIGWAEEMYELMMHMAGID